MSNRIGPDANIYGTYAKISALADFVEVCTLKNVRVTRARLADLILDNRWQLRDLMVGPEDEDIDESLGAAQDLARDAADRVFAMLKERADTLGALYPFHVEAEQLVLDPAFDIGDSTYVAMLAITIAHAFGFSDEPAPTQVLEDVVEDVLQTQIRLAINFGRIRRETNPFEKALEAACPSIRLVAAPKSAWRSKRAQDENVDSIAHIHWGDDRAGTWSVIGQVTCARSDEWEGKLDEPKAATWALFLGVAPDPLVFLAVPHHVERGHLARLVQGARGIVLDRLRLARDRSKIADAERALVEQMMQAELDAI
jgi:hypothetical protein